MTEILKTTYEVGPFTFTGSNLEEWLKNKCEVLVLGHYFVIPVEDINILTDRVEQATGITIEHCTDYSGMMARVLMVLNCPEAFKPLLGKIKSDLKQFLRRNGASIVAMMDVTSEELTSEQLLNKAWRAALLPSTVGS